MSEQIRVRFFHDADTESPREWENLGSMVCWHTRYSLGDEQPSGEPVEWLAEFREEHPDRVVLPLFLYDHSGITIRTQAFSCPWDSGQVGYIAATPADAERIGVAWDPEKIRTMLESEVRVYDQYITGAIFCFVVERGVECDHGDIHWDHVDSCGGFYGHDLEASGALEHIGDEHHEAAREQWRSVGVEVR